MIGYASPVPRMLPVPDSTLNNVLDRSMLLFFLIRVATLAAGTPVAGPLDVSVFDGPNDLTFIANGPNDVAVI
jgi:hypothetical protein